MKFHYFLIALPLLALVGCKNDEPNIEPEPEPPVKVDGEGETPDYDPESIPTFDYTFKNYAGEKATDAVSYQPNNADLNPDDNDWTNIVTVTYNGSSASVDAPTGVTATILGCNVELKLGSTKNVKVVATGSSANGSLTLTGYYKHMLELKDLTLTSTDRPAINDQITKRVFLMLTGTSKIEDGTNYEYKTSKRKGCFYAADHVIICGDGSLEVKGNNRHGFATDGFLFVNPGATLAVTDAKKNAIHVDGSGVNNNYRGIEMAGGYVYAHSSAGAGKAMKCDGRVALRGGKLALYSTGDAAVDPEDGLLSSPGCIKSDSTVSISGGEIILTATGIGAKGISADFDINLSGVNLTIANSGKSTANDSDNSVAKALNAHGNISITAGGVNLSAIGSGSTAISCDANFSMTNGVVYAFGANYGVKALKANVAGGNFICGGAQFTAVDGTSVTSYTDIKADHVTVLTNPEDDTTLAAFRWPIDMATAQLLTR
ncbi:MAG: carbohydrate-binding domain-containing protein [Bacteroides sp.]|nr:carbohydrate-binding domain-containing protein [Bacteroides sp.]MCM1378633.1 carbohydrate-binding domain-containing protein [Bacteroides sp.]MCM1446393.1 carbohydrate-binding domain-containing protein [Prevotella sp.]